MDPSQWSKVRHALESLLDVWRDQDPEELDDRIRMAAEEVGVDAGLLRELLGADRPSSALAEGVDLIALLDKLAPWED